MAWQLIFTSAPAGLNPGSSGYCTVGRSAGMRDAVAARLEQWSVYTRPAQGTSPVICAHRVLDLRGTIFHVLTRIVDSGVDYTGRTNFLAHHLVVQPHELAGAPSPADIFLKGPFWQSQWSGIPRSLDDVYPRDIPPRSSLPARNWENAAGDARGAALLVDEAGEAARSADLVAQPGQEEGLLLLYGESLCLLDAEPAASWSVPFTTYLQTENDPADFVWRGLWAGNRQNPGGARINFTDGTFPPMPENTPARHARTGRKPLAYAPPSRPAASVSGGTSISTVNPQTTPPRDHGAVTSQPALADREDNDLSARRPWPLIAGIAGGAAVLLAIAGDFLLKPRPKTPAPAFRHTEVPVTPTPEPVAPASRASAPPPPEPSAAIAAAPPEQTPAQPTATPIVEPLIEKHVREPAYAAIDPGEAVYIIDVSGNEEQTVLRLPLPAGNPIARLIERRLYTQYRVAISFGGTGAPISLWHPPDTAKYFGLTFRAQDRCLVINTDDRAITDRDYAFGNTEVQTRREIKNAAGPAPGADIPESTLVSFTPKNPADNPSLQPFHLLMIKFASGTRWAPIKLPQGLLEKHGGKLAVKNADDLRACLAKWLDQNGKPISTELRCTYGGSFRGLPLGSGSDAEIDFAKVQEDLSRKYVAEGQPPPAPPPSPNAPAAPANPGNRPMEQIKNLNPETAMDPKQARLWIDKAGGSYRIPLIEFVVPTSR